MSRAVVLPVFNERAFIGMVLDAVHRVFDGAVFVVDDGSTDGTAELLADRRDLRLVKHATNLGYGQSIRDGLRAAVDAGADRVLTMDCDGQHEPRHIGQFFDALDAVDVVSGSRYLPGSRQVGLAPPSDRRAVNQRVTDEINRVTGWGLTDAFCGFKAYRAHVLQDLRLSETGFGLPVELWARLFQRGIRPTEVPVERIYVSYTRSFGPGLDDADARLAFYLRVWQRTLADGT